MTKNVILQNAEIQIKNGKTGCIRCHEFKLPDEMNLERLCYLCLEEIKARNKGKPKPEHNQKKIEKRNGTGSIEREDALPMMQDFEIDVKPVDAIRAISRIGFSVSETHPESVLTDKISLVTPDLNGQVDMTLKKALESSEIGENILKRLDAIEKSQEETNGLLAQGLKRIAILEKNVYSIIEKDKNKKSDDGMKKLRDDLFAILKERHNITQRNGIYVKSLYGPKGRPGGKLRISKATAWRLKESCRVDNRFKVEKSETMKGGWLIRLNLYLN
ncbi:Uncharacterised protein [uncultured archaeon]|nr:Uncharacterised protein [uncultured archaeon]